jgi:hypothetical protein
LVAKVVPASCDAHPETASVVASAAIASSLKTLPA